MIYIGKQLLGSPSSLKLLHTFGKSEVKVIQSRLTLCNPMDCSPPGSSVRGNLQARNTGVGSHSLLQGIFLTQRLNLGLLHCRQILFIAVASLERNCNSPLLEMPTSHKDT